MSKYRKVIHSCAFLFCLGIVSLHAAVAKESEVKDTSEPVRRFSDRYNNNGNNVPYSHHLHKRQISSQFQSFAQTQFFQRPSFDTAGIDFNSDTSQPDDDSSAIFNRRPVFSSQDEEERFFLSRETTTLNPLSFFTTQTTTTTLDPIEQQQIEEQRRFQEEIANKGLREQQQNLFTTTTTSTTTPSPDLSFLDQLQSDPNSFTSSSDSTFPSLETVPQSLLELNNIRPQGGRFSQSVQTPAQSYSFVRTFRRRRSIDLQPSGNEIDDLAVSSTASPQQALVNSLLQDTNPREDLVKIGGWLVDNLAKTFERNIAQFAEGAIRQRSIVKPVPYSTPANFFLPPQKSTPRPLRILNAPEPPSQYLSPEYHSTPKPVQNFAVPESRPVYFQESQSTAQPSANKLIPVDANLFQEYQSTPKQTQNIIPVDLKYSQEYQSTSQPVHLFHSPEFPANPLPITFAQTTPKIDLNQFQWSTPPSVSYNWKPESLLYQPQTPKIESVTYPTSTIGSTSVTLPSILVPQNGISSTTILPKIRNIQILPTSTLTPEENYSNAVFRTTPAYSFDQHTTPRPVETTTVYVPAHHSTSTENEASITSLFKSRLNTLKDKEMQDPSLLQRSVTETQQANQVFDLLGQSNVTASPNGVDSESNSPIYSTLSSVTPSTAIFIKAPEDTLSSTAGYIFDKTIPVKHKKENSYASKKNNRSPQVLKSTLVYRTPPGKRATLARNELARNEQMEAGLLSHILEAQGKPISSWLLGQTRQTTTSRPFVTALMNFIRKRSPAS